MAAFRIRKNLPSKVTFNNSDHSLKANFEMFYKSSGFKA